MDADANDIISNGLGNAITRDGQGHPTANLPMAGFRHTGAAAGVGTGDYVTVGQATNGTLAADVASLTVAGASTFSAGVVASGQDANGANFRAVGGTGSSAVGAMLHNDGTSFYVLLTPAGTPLGSWTTARPLMINTTTAAVSIDETGAGLTLGAAGGTTAVEGALTVVSNITGSNVTTQTGTVGAAGLTAGDTTHPGILDIRTPSNTRAGYVGYSDGGVNLLLETEGGFTGWSVTGNLHVFGTATATTPAAKDASTNIATTAFVNPGASLGGAGYQKLPSGLNLQWGSASASTVGSSATNSVSVAFTEAFPTGCVAVFVSFFNAQGGCSCSASGFSTTGCTVSYANLSSATQTLQAYYFAIGY